MITGWSISHQKTDCVLHVSSELNLIPLIILYDKLVSFMEISYVSDKRINKREFK